MIKRIKEKLDIIIPATRHAKDLEVYLNPSSVELAKLIKKSYLNRIRFVLNHNGDYLCFDSNSLHERVIANYKDFDENDLYGQVFGYSDEIYLYEESTRDFWRDLGRMKDWKAHAIQRFKETRFYNTLNSLGIFRVDMGRWI
jgi:hypothetical protein